MAERIASDEFYGEYHGHRTEHLEVVLNQIRQDDDAKPVMWLAGDSSLDNKYWFHETGQAAGAYARVLDPPRSALDVAHHLNDLAGERGISVACVNTAVEESTLSDRVCGSLLPQDEFLRDHMAPQDILCVSVGGNDIALRPQCCTICNMLCLVKCMPMCCIESQAESWIPCAHPCPCDEFCCGCGASCWSTCFACPPCTGYFVHLFRTRLEHYLNALTSVTSPDKIILLMIYYPDEVAGQSWADVTLGALGYNNNPKKLQTLIDTTFKLGTCKVVVSGGSDVVPIQLSDVLDGKTSQDYAQRVEPSAIGGRTVSYTHLTLPTKRIV
eukprot:TRINITY_DN2111_c0_g1_i11.p1 TRINITY_DN2111_c0_g1~~TRINITY_DN2111_c0_g1_i11.p1  ORF type:complete len:327 (-),score=43.82 TRINITY_DN2111_c0_g1_i11:358-1338(-)